MSTATAKAPIRTEFAAPAKRFRPEIEGLRAVAALLVAVFHIYLGRVSGGVDVFFVVSGFLISTSLLGMHARTGAINVNAFFSRLGTRLLPAALVVLLAVLAATALLMPASRQAGTYLELATSALYAENWHLVWKATDYLSQGEASSPVQHFWAMSIQGQFYILWGLLFSAVLFAARKAGAGFRSRLAIALGAVFVLSLAFSVYYTAANQPVAYFHTLARVWEFALGGLVALAIDRFVLPAAVRFAAVWAGLAAIVACGLVFQVSTLFPGYVALVPTLGASLILLASGGYQRLGADRLLSLPVLTKLGGISYGIYLWHWPILVFVRVATGRDEVGLVPGLAIIAASVALAFLTNRFVEKPVQAFVRSRSLSPRQVLAAATALVVAFSLACAGAWWSIQRTGDGFDAPGARAFLDGGAGASDPQLPLVPALSRVKSDVAVSMTDGCTEHPKGAELVECVYGVEDGSETVVLVGGSHSVHWLPALQAISTERDLRIVSLTKNTCPFSTDTYSSSANAPSCAEWNEKAAERILEIEPDYVFTTSTRGSGDKEQVPAGYLEQWEELGDAGIEVVAVRDTPRMAEDYLECLERNGPGDPACGAARESLRADRSPVDLLEDKPGNVHFLDLTDHICGPRTCLPAAGNVVVYRDPTHLTATYSRTLGVPLGQALEKAGF